MAQNITTLLKKTEITAAEIRSLESTVDNFLYLVHGTGSTRDKKINLKQLRVWLSLLTELTLVKAFTGGQSTVGLDGEKIELSATGEAVNDNSEAELSRIELKFTKTDVAGNYVSYLSPSEFQIACTDDDDNVSFVGLSDVAVQVANIDAQGNVLKSTDISSTRISTLNLVGAQENPNSSERVLTVDSNLVIGLTPSTKGNSLTVKGSTNVDNSLFCYGLNVTGAQGETHFATFGVGANFNSFADFYNSVKFRSRVVSEVQTYNPNASPAQSIDVDGGSVIWVKPDLENQTIDLTELLSSALVGQRFTILSEKSLKLKFDPDMTTLFEIEFGYKGCDFVVVEKVTSPTTKARLRPVGCNGNFSS